MPTPHGTRRDRGAATKAFLRQWIHLNWRDCVSMLSVGVIAIAIYYSPVPVTRTFPVTLTGTGDVVYPDWAYPYRGGWIIPAWASGLASIGGPIAVYIVAQIRIRSAWDASAAIMGSVWAVILGSLFQVILKQLCGGFRPYFLDVCKPDLSLAPVVNKTGLNGVGFQRIMYTTDICTQTAAEKLKTAITSFPSGHSTAAFAGFGFLFLWMNAKLKVWADHRPAFHKLLLTIVPLLLASLIACSLTIDAAHNWWDIVVGALIGVAMALASYRATYAAVWDWRFNHIPLMQAEAFAYDGDVYLAADTLTRTAGWGRKRTWLSEDPGNALGDAGPGARTRADAV
ncbi:PAP2 superfamily protein [Purpureocillium lavendulum]|uniref:PAP2 superfamily protein n=1 Tax=Purpureocillium lavendulum TaxID=1247861 RepID=A0AB34FGT9_9HYPO|nr:PAP2 superfamily protein [Purpureocillium lavendulum]